MVTRGKFPYTAKGKVPQRVLSGRVPFSSLIQWEIITLHRPALDATATFTNLLKVAVKQECKPTAVISGDGFTDFG